MTKTILLASLLCAVTAAGAQAPAGTSGTPGPGGTPRAAAAASCPPLLAHTLPRLQDDAPQSLCQYAGQVLLVVNTASLCGYTGQYEGLEALHERYRRRGFTVLGFPSNDFGQQEPGSNRQIADFCVNTYAVKFPMFAKSVVSGAQAHPLFLTLAAQAGAPRWNFHKYLIGRDGRVVTSFPSAVEPLDKRLTRTIEDLLRNPA